MIPNFKQFSIIFKSSLEILLNPFFLLTLKFTSESVSLSFKSSWFSSRLTLGTCWMTGGPVGVRSFAWSTLEFALCLWFPACSRIVFSIGKQSCIRLSNTWSLIPFEPLIYNYNIFYTNVNGWIELRPFFMHVLR